MKMSGGKHVVNSRMHDFTSDSFSAGGYSRVGQARSLTHTSHMHVSLKFLQIQKEQCRHLRCTECCFCGGQFSELPVDQEPEMPANKQCTGERGGTRSGGGTADGNGSVAEQQMDNIAGWDEGTCAQCGACYQRSRIRPALCPCGAELCGYSLRCLLLHAKWTCSISPQEQASSDAAASQNKYTQEKNKDDFVENNVLPPRVVALPTEGPHPLW